MSEIYKNISIVTGTLNRKAMLPDLISNTVDSDSRLELVLVDGGSTDGTIEFIKELNHPKIKLIEVGGRSSYPHFMNLGIKNASYELICQWNDDVLLSNEWDEVFNSLDDSDFFIFNWKYGDKESLTNSGWLNGSDTEHPNGGWCLLDESSTGGEIVMNYGIYNKKIFREIGLYNNEYKYYYADGDMCYRAHSFGYQHKSLRNIKVCSINTRKRAVINPDDTQIYRKNLKLYDNNKLSEHIEYLK